MKRNILNILIDTVVGLYPLLSMIGAYNIAQTESYYVGFIVFMGFILWYWIYMFLRNSESEEISNESQNLRRELRKYSRDIHPVNQELSRLKQFRDLALKYPDEEFHLASWQQDVLRWACDEIEKREKDDV